MSEDRQARRYPQNLQGVLQMAVDAGSTVDSPSPGQSISDENRKWLKEALSEICSGQMDDVQQIKQCLAILMQEDESGDDEEERNGENDDYDEQESAFDILSDLCENLDNARDLMILGGLDICVSKYLCHNQSGLRWRAAQLIASSAQNMPQVQAHLMSLDALPTLLHLTDSDPHPTVRVKALYAVSCLVRQQEAGFNAFLQLDGFSILMKSMQSENDKLQTKSAFLLLNLLTSHPEQKETVVSMGMVQQLVAILRTPHSSFHEHVLGVLCCLVDNFPPGVKECRNPSLNLEELLKQRAEDLQYKDESQEELEFCNRLRTVCFHNQQSKDVGMDR